MIEDRVVKEAKGSCAVLYARLLGHLLGELLSQMTIIKRPDIGLNYSLLTDKCIDLSLL